VPAKRPCSFCAEDIEPGTGKMFIRRDGTIHFFCSSKCERNLLNLGRVPRWTRWTKPYRRAKGLVEEEGPAAAPIAAEGEEGGALLAVEAPKGKAIPADVVDLIDKRLGPDLGRAQAEKYFSDFSGSDTLKIQITPWYRKKHGGKHVEKIESQEYLSFLETPQGRNTLKRWLDDESRKVKGRRGGEEEGEERAPAFAPKAAKKAKKEA
jgi:large subunit ribosomal protein L24e